MHGFRLRFLIIPVMVSAASLALMTCIPAGEAPRPMDPAAWGSDHVGRTFPEYVTGDECLFCHRKIGPAWNDNRHQMTVRAAQGGDPAIKTLRELAGDNDAAKQTQFLMGSRRITRFLKRSKEYGKLEILSASFVPNNQDRQQAGELTNGRPLNWDAKTFGDRCAGCHATAVDAKTRAFSAISLDCFTCHGDVDLKHTKDVSRVFLSAKNRQPRQVVSTCGQCHLRGGKSKSSGLPYPNTFVAGDNLFRDFQVDLSDAAIKRLPAIEQHIYVNARDVAVSNKSATTCLTCHNVHGQSSEKHQQLKDGAICSSCHIAGKDKSELRDSLQPTNRLRTHSRVCGY